MRRFLIAMLFPRLSTTGVFAARRVLIPTVDGSGANALAAEIKPAV
jgi:hypothetical protein